jgi:hypothetical protein
MVQKAKEDCQKLDYLRHTKASKFPRITVVMLHTVSYQFQIPLEEQIYLKEIPSILSWIGRETTYWAERADMAAYTFHFHESKLGILYLEMT